MHEAAQTFGDVSDPARLAVFAVADDIDAGLGLFANHVRNLSA